jgi:hypothetical protein
MKWGRSLRCPTSPARGGRRELEKVSGADRQHSSCDTTQEARSHCRAMRSQVNTRVGHRAQGRGARTQPASVGHVLERIAASVPEVPVRITSGGLAPIPCAHRLSPRGTPGWAMLWRHPGVGTTRQHGEPAQRHGLWGTPVATALASPDVTAQSDGEAAVSTGWARRAHRPQTRLKRLVRKTLCCAQSTLMPAIVIGVLVHRSILGRAVYTWPSPLVLHDPHRHLRHARGTRPDRVPFAVAPGEGTGVQWGCAVIVGS